MADQFTDSREYQIKLLAYMLGSHDFCAAASDTLRDEHFSDRALQWFFETLRDAPIKLSPATLQHELVKSVQNKVIKQDEIDKYIGYFNHIKVKPLPVEEQHITSELGKFIRMQATKKALVESWDLAKDENWEEIVDKLQSAVSQGLDVLEMGSFFFKDYKQRLQDRSNQVSLPKLSTGIPDLDDLLYGGLKPKQLGLIAGGTGRGKSVFLAWLARVGVLLGKTVVYYTFELSEEDIAERFDSLFTHTRINELQTYDNKVFTAMSSMSGKFGDKLIIKEYPPDAATVGTLKGHLRQLSGIGVIPDLVIVDYLDLIKPHRNYHTQHEELDAITKALRGLAVEFATRVWTATQLNRSGMGMETPDETSIAGAVSKLFTADVSLFMAQTKEEREDAIMRILVAKNRNGPAGRTIQLDTDYSHMTFYRAPVIVAGQAGQSSQTEPTASPDQTSEEIEDDGSAQKDQAIGQVDGATEEGDMLVLQ